MTPNADAQRDSSALFDTPRQHRSRLACRDYVLDALRKAMEARHRFTGLEWIDYERQAVAIAANQWADAHGIERTVTVHDVERIEVTAVGHVDYGPKLALYIAEYVTDTNGRPS